MRRAHQHVYASNLLRGQDFGYPLRNPKPDDKSAQEGLQVGDVGHVDENGKFHQILNIRCLPQELQGRIPGFNLVQPVGELEFKPKKVIVAGVKRIATRSQPRYLHVTVDASRVLHRGRADYEFAVTSQEGAILILPDGAIRCELDQAQAKELEKHIKEHALEMCKFANQETLYLVTAVFRSKSWTLGSFYKGSNDCAILVNQLPRGSPDPFMYDWVCEVNMDDKEGPKNNDYLNQTVLIKGFKITMRWDWLPVVERLGGNEWWFISFLASLWSAVLLRWLRRIGKLYPVFRGDININCGQTSIRSPIGVYLRSVHHLPYVRRQTVLQPSPYHPLDIINRVLLEQVCAVNVGAHIILNRLPEPCSGDSRHS